MKAVHFRPDLNVKQREQELKKLCVTEKEENFFRTLTDSDVDKEKHLYAEKGGELKEKKAEAKASADTFKTSMQAIEKDMDERLERIQTRKRKVYDKLYGLPNYQSGLMEFYDRFGEMIDSRKLTPDETTGHLFNNDGGATSTNEAKQLGYEAGGLADGQAAHEDIQDAEYEEVQDADVAPAGEPDPSDTDNVAPAAEETDKEAKAPKKPRKPRKKNDEDTNTESK